MLIRIRQHHLRLAHAPIPQSFASPPPSPAAQAPGTTAAAHRFPSCKGRVFASEAAGAVPPPAASIAAAGAFFLQRSSSAGEESLPRHLHHQLPWVIISGTMKAPASTPVNAQIQHILFTQITAAKPNRPRVISHHHKPSIPNHKFTTTSSLRRLVANSSC
ncbi:MAG: hypothetical protein R3E31_21765 [Chloroflexota bacterium]